MKTRVDPGDVFIGHEGIFIIIKCDDGFIQCIDGKGDFWIADEAIHIRTSYRPVVTREKIEDEDTWVTWR